MITYSHMVSFMKHHKEVDALIRRAEQERRCATGIGQAQRAALSRRATAQELRRVFPNMYASPSYWDALDPAERAVHIARTLHSRRPNWVFAGVTAASIHGFDHPWAMHDGTITIATPNKGAESSSSKVKRIFMAACEPEHIDGIPVTDGARTVVDCGLKHKFRHALPVADSALSKGVTPDAILSVCAGLRQDCTAVFRLLHYANPASENGGESLARATIVEGGFVVPLLQQPIIDPRNGVMYRVDFMWRLNDGRIIVGEYDGMRKYADPTMTSQGDVRGTVRAERDREDALRQAGVSTIVRFAFNDVIRRRPLWDRLRAAGIPQTNGPRF